MPKLQASRFDRMDNRRTPPLGSSRVKSEHDLSVKPPPAPGSINVPAPKLPETATYTPISLVKEEEDDYILRQEGIFWDPKVPFTWKEYPVQYFNRYADVSESNRVAEFSWKVGEWRNLRLLMCSCPCLQVKCSTSPPAACSTATPTTPPRSYTHNSPWTTCPRPSRRPRNA